MGAIMPHKIAATANLRRSPQLIRPNFLRLCPARNGLDQWEYKIPFRPGELILSGVGEAVCLRISRADCGKRTKRHLSLEQDQSSRVRSPSRIRMRTIPRDRGNFRANAPNENERDFPCAESAP